MDKDERKIGDILVPLPYGGIVSAADCSLEYWSGTGTIEMFGIYCEYYMATKGPFIYLLIRNRLMTFTEGVYRPQQGVGTADPEIACENL